MITIWWWRQDDDDDDDHDDDGDDDDDDDDNDVDDDNDDDGGDDNDYYNDDNNDNEVLCTFSPNSVNIYTLNVLSKFFPFVSYVYLCVSLCICWINHWNVKKKIMMMMIK